MQIPAKGGSVFSAIQHDASYLLHLNGFPVGGFENWRDGLGWEIWRAYIAQPLSAAEREAWRKCEMAARAEREADAVERRAKARERAGEIWQAARPAPADHPYLLAKGVLGDGLRVHKEALVVPLRDAAGEL